MKNRLSCAIAVLVAAMLACKVPLIDDQPEGASFTEILSMAVEPRAGPGSGSFKLEVTYRAYREDPPEIYCNYVRPDGATIPINTIVPLGPRGTLFTIRPYSTTETRELPFSVTKKDVVTKLGTYTAGCGDGYGNPLTTTFIVVEEVGLDEMGTDFSKVLNMAVTPSSGSGNFTLEVTYRWNDSIADTGSPPDIYCNYVSPDGATTPVGIIYPTYVEVTTTKIEKLEFSVTQADGKTKPVTYVASCTPEGEEDEDGTTLTTTFTVVGEVTATITPTAESRQPIQIKSTGQKTTSNWDFQPNYCTTTADLVLTITEDGWGKLEITGDAFYDHMNCLGGIGWEKWLVEGAANVANETVSFMSCSRGDTASNEFNAQGTISYSGGVLSGEVTCLGKSGSEAGRVVTIIKAP